MTVEPSWRINHKDDAEDFHDAIYVGLLVLDTRLQAITDAPKCEHGKIDGHSVPVDPLNPYPGRLVKNWCPGASELRTLLDALAEEER